METKKIVKWGFGMAPLKSGTALANKKAAYSLVKILNIKDKLLELKYIDDISHFKGMVNRCIKQDQWDWFTVYSKFNRPPIDVLEKIVPLLVTLRKAIQQNSDELFENTKRKLINYNTLEFCENYLSSESVDKNFEGYVYILSRKEEPEILKIGMTTRDIETRVKEINSATGVLYPYSARMVFKVNSPELAEKIVFQKLKEYRIRNDREFFHIKFKDAVKVIISTLKESNLFVE